MGIILFIVSIILSIPLFPLGLIYSLVKMSLIFTSKTLLLLAIGVDRMGNVICAELFNDTLIKSEGYKFGSLNETVSKVLGINKRTNTLTTTGRLLADFLNWIDPNHVEKASEEKTS